MSDMIRTENLSKRFRSTPALNEATLVVPEGAIYALVGANGAGKTTLIKLLMNIFRPTCGRAQVMGIECRHLAGRDFQRIGYVSENQEMPDWMTVEAMLDYLRPFYPQWDRRPRTTTRPAVRPSTQTQAQTSLARHAHEGCLCQLACLPAQPDRAG